MIWSRIPWTIDAIAITVATPMTTPRIVSAERSLLTRSASSATATFCWTLSVSRTDSLRPRRGDRVEARRARGRIDAEEDADAGPERDGDGDGPERDARGEWRDGGDEEREGRARRDAEQAPERGEHHGFGEKLSADVTRRRADRLAQADLPRALVHGHEHDVHDDDPADDDPDRHHGGDDAEEDAGEVAPEGDERLRRLDGEVVLLPRAQAVRETHRLLRPGHPPGHRLRARHLHRDRRRQPPAVEHLEDGQGQEHEAVERLAEHASLPLDGTDDLEPFAVDAHLASDGLRVLEQPLGDVGADHGDAAALRDVELVERSAVGEAVVLHDLILGTDAEDEHVPDRAVAPDDVALRCRPPGLDRHGVGIGKRFLHLARVGDGDAGTALHAAPDRKSTRLNSCHLVIS